MLAHDRDCVELGHALTGTAGLLPSFPVKRGSGDTQKDPISGPPHGATLLPRTSYQLRFLCEREMELGIWREKWS